MKQHLITIPAIIGTALLTAVIVQDSPARQDQPANPVVANLSAKVDTLEARVAKLEHASGVVAHPPSSGTFDHETPSDLSHAEGGRWMIIDNIQTSQFSPNYSNQIASLQQQAASLENTIQTEQENTRDLEMVAGGRNADVNVRGDRERAQQELVSRYQTQLDLTNKKINRLTQDMNALTQIIHGHEGDVILTLQTTHDLSDALNALGEGAYVTWTGRRVDMSEGHESWEVDMVRPLNGDKKPSSGQGSN